MGRRRGAGAELFKRQHSLEPASQRPLASESGAILYQGDQLLTKLPMMRGRSG